MTAVPSPEPNRPHPRAASIQTYARLAGALLLLSLVAGGFGEFYAPSRIVVPGNATATAANLHAHVALFRWGFAGYLVEAMCDLTLTMILYVLLRTVSRPLALLAALFRIMATTTFGFAELFYFAALPISGSAASLKAFSPDQLNALALLSFRLYGTGAGLFLAFYGVASILFGVLIVRSAFLPRILGFLLALGGLGFVVQNVALVLAPAYAWSFLPLPTLVASLAMGLWLLARGVNVAKWEECAA